MMQGLSVLDVLVILAVVALLWFAGSRDSARYARRTAPPPATATPQAGN